MRVLILHSRYLSWAASGENRVVDDETRLLADGGHEVECWDPPFSTSGPGLIQAGMGAIWNQKAAVEMRRRIRRVRPDVVHFHNLFPKLSPAAVRAAEDEGVAVAMTLHNYRLMCLPGTLRRAGEVCELCVGKVPWRGVTYRCLRGSALGSGALAASLTLHRSLDTFSRVALCLAVSEFVRAKHIESGLSPDQVVVKRNFAWETERRRGPGEFFLYLGRLSSEKGVDTLMRACKRWPFPLVVVGDGPEIDVLRAAAPEGVDLRGAVPPDEVPEILARTRALLVPSRWYEPAPKAILEAYAAGVPVVASRIGGLPELVEDGSSGLLVDVDDVEGWTRAVERLSDDCESEALGKGARELWTGSYTPAHGLAALEDAYGRALERAR